VSAPAGRRLAGRALLAAAGAAAGAVALAQVRRRTAPAGVPTARWARSNYRGSTVDLAGGPALAVAATAGALAGSADAGSAAAAVVAGLGAGGVGLYDDLVGGRPEHRAKGFHGHLAALRQGRLTSGVVKLAGVGASALVAAALLPGRPASGRPAPRSSRPLTAAVELLLGAGVIAGAANLLNLLDLRPGRALKVGLLVGTPLAAGPGGELAAGPVGAAAAGLPADLAERTMLGDCGANALGALLGTSVVARTGPVGRAVVLAGIAALTAASERVSFTQVIARTPGLRELDELGRRPDPPRQRPPGLPAG
jgi:UDP-N-acetylmuramyl pentapeptide phosphotransferase/UDP-N-acetylglucosamine-1-phosphate transferase